MFERMSAARWHEEIPGSRWFKADLHIHTLEDLPGKSIKMPQGVSGEPASQATLDAYARALLRSATRAGVQVLGLTPHSARIEGSATSSAVWTVVDTWNTQEDDDGVPFREKIYAVFPGFEPSLNEGKSGLHLLFLFDPEIGMEAYFDAFGVVMNGVPAWKGKTLQMSRRPAGDALRALAEFYEETCGTDGSGARLWSYLVLAPHIENEKGLIGAMKSQVLGHFEHEHIAGLELPDNKLPADVTANRPWLIDGMKQHLQSFFYSSDAYDLDSNPETTSQTLGHRFTWVKLATPRIEALRQAFIAGESRLRLTFDQAAKGGLIVADRHPDPLVTDRPWIRSLTVRGGTSFFGGGANGDGGTRVQFSPDLTCIIGGSMTGKSTLLDGMRNELGLPFPRSEQLEKVIRERATKIFKPDAACEVSVDFMRPSGDEQGDGEFSALFFAQGELRDVSDDSAAVETLLSRLDRTEHAGIDMRSGRLLELDELLKREATRLEAKYDREEELAQLLQQAREAKRALDAVKHAGMDALHAASTSRDFLEHGSDDVKAMQTTIKGLGVAVRDFASSEMRDALNVALESQELDEELDDELDIVAAHAAISERVAGVEEALRSLGEKMVRAATLTREHESEVQASVEQGLVEQGFEASKLHELKSLTEAAGRVKGLTKELTRVRKEIEELEKGFGELTEERGALVEEQRSAYARIAARVERRRSGAIQVAQLHGGDYQPLEAFLYGLKRKGVSQWWNGKQGEPWKAMPAVEQVLEALGNDDLQSLGMSDAVANTFKEAMTRSNLRALQSVRCPDVYEIRERVDSGEFRPLSRLSGGRRVATLLWLLLDADDQRPLVVDQPEDELDNTFLWGSVLPALRKLKGHRQVIVVTHNPNVVVNADADLVVQLDASADRGHVEVQGAIESSEVRAAIVSTVDGGRAAFELRRAKYGF